MKSWRIPLALLTAAALALPAPAGLLFGKKTKPNPTERVPELIVIVKTDKDESKRAAAAEELRQYDPAANADMVPILIDVMLNDAKPSVRAEAAETLGKLRPVSKEVGWALEQAEEKDSSWRVRTKAHYVLMTYKWSGYHPEAKPKDGPAVPNPKDAPPDKGKVATPAPAPTPSPANKGTPDKVVVTPPAPKAPAVPPIRPITGESAAPPLAPPSPAPKPLPSAPTPPPAPVKVEASPLPPVPVPAPEPPAKTEPSPLPAIPLPPPGE